MDLKGADNLDNFFKGICKKNSLKVTTQRTAIYRELVKTKEHPYAELVYKKVKGIFPNISFDTVYRTLLTFVNIGLADVIAGSGDPKRFDGNIKKHHHFKCIKCNNLFDFNFDAYHDIKVPEEIEKQFTILNSRIIFEGICNKCSSR